MIFSKCQNCKRRAIIVKQRYYHNKHVGEIKSQSKLCGKCYRGIKAMVKKMDDEPKTSLWNKVYWKIRVFIHKLIK